MSNYGYPAGMALSCALGGSATLDCWWRTGPIMVQIHNAFALGHNDALWGSKENVARLGFKTAMESAESRGKGNRAYKREGLISTMSDQRLACAMRERDRRLHADLYFDREVEARSYPQHESFHG